LGKKRPRTTIVYEDNDYQEHENTSLKKKEVTKLSFKAGLESQKRQKKTWNLRVYNKFIKFTVQVSHFQANPLFDRISG